MEPSKRVSKMPAAGETNAKETASSKTQAASATNGLPLFFSSPVPVNPARHGKAGIRSTENFNFARNTNSIAVSTAEFAEVAKFYPIAFTEGEAPMPVAIVGLERENYFIDAKGTWAERTYVPAYARKYPFVFMALTDSNEYALCIDEDAPHFVADDSTNELRLFDDAGKPTAFTQNALTFCAMLQKEWDQTTRFCTKLKELDLLAPQHSEAQLPQGRILRLSGFQIIDVEKFNKLPETTILELHREGFLHIIYYAMLSTSNWRQLLDLASASEKKKAA